MKKLLSLALIVLSCLAFASCDAVEQFVPGLNDSGSTNGETEEVRTTITKEEWLSAINSTNFSMVGNNYNSNGDVIMIQSMYFSETAALVYSWAELGDTLTETAQYTAIIDGVGYTITKEDSGYVGVAADTTVEKLEIKLCQANASVVDSWENLYDTFVYDEESKTYKANCTYSGNEATFEAFFEDGKAIKFEIKFVKYGNNCTVTYSNFATTVIEIPDFWTKLPYEKWLELFKVDNYSVELEGFNGYVSASVKYTSTSTYAYSTVGENVSEVYGTIIDGITYKIEKVDGSYVATKSETEYKAPSVFDALETHVDWETMYENLSYDEEADLYIAQIFDESNNEEILKFKLKDGKITEACYASMDSVGSIIEKYEFTDFGITVVELPEFTFAE